MKAVAFTLIMISAKKKEEGIENVFQYQHLPMTPNMVIHEKLESSLSSNFALRCRNNYKVSHVDN